MKIPHVPMISSEDDKGRQAGIDPGHFITTDLMRHHAEPQRDAIIDCALHSEFPRMIPESINKVLL